MAAVSFLFALFALVLTVGGGLLLYALVRTEGDHRSVTDRETAEQMARRDSRDETGGDGREGRDDGTDEPGVTGNHWG